MFVLCNVRLCMHAKKNMQTLDQLGSLFVRFSVVWYISIEAQVEKKTAFFSETKELLGKFNTHKKTNQSNP